MDNEKSYESKAKKDLLDLITTRMPFGKYKGRVICDLPETYLVWFSQKGFPDGRIGTLLQIMYGIKAEGIEHIVYSLRSKLQHKR
ncbi:MAG: DUF3820 family protein [Bacteroidales bacterium]|jgi:uncharacterized protein (DUF3820 family)|nr:DUF3820 family protein [Bacteroidales bacterium]